MIFHVLNGGEKKSYEPSNAYLIRNNWDDYGFKTTFYLVYARANGEAETIGSVKIMRRGMRSGYVDVPDTFELLDDDYCSLDASNGDVFSGGERFTNLVTVAFSAFDPFLSVLESDGDIRHAYIGLRKTLSADGLDELKSYDELASEFLESFSRCLQFPRSRRWRDSISILESDPLFRDANLVRFVDYHAAGQIAEIEREFRGLSSGHKIVLLTTTRLVELVDDRTLVLFDEPESHLHLYDRIIASSPVCPMCGQGKVSTLDHYLPKSRYAQFAILAANLVPCCRDCNVERGVLLPVDAQGQTFHPYFDNVENDRWLYAQVVLTDGASIEYFVSTPGHWPATLAGRAASHFKVFRLGELFGTFAATELASIKYRLQKTSMAAGSDGVRQDLRLQADSSRSVHLNSWKTAMYEALSGSDDFCDGGFEAIGE